MVEEEEEVEEEEMEEEVVEGKEGDGSVNKILVPLVEGTVTTTFDSFLISLALTPLNESTTG